MTKQMNKTNLFVFGSKFIFPSLLSIPISTVEYENPKAKGGQHETTAAMRTKIDLRNESIHKINVVDATIHGDDNSCEANQIHRTALYQSQNLRQKGESKNFHFHD